MKSGEATGTTNCAVTMVYDHENDSTPVTTKADADRAAKLAQAETLKADLVKK